MKNQLPSILTANTYFWQPSSSASQRRRNEERKIGEVYDFFKSNGFDTSISDGVVATKGDLCVRFTYSESCKNVYKRLSVYVGEKKSNITAIVKVLS